MDKPRESCEKCHKKPAKFRSKRLDQTWRPERKYCGDCALKQFGKYDVELWRI